MGGLLFDLDGVIYNGEVAIDGAAEAIAWVREEGIPHLFLTNASSRGRGAIAEKLTRMGIPTSVTQIMSPAAAAADWLRAHAAGPAALFIRDKTKPEVEGVALSDSVARYVVVGDLGELWDFHTLNRAFRLLHGNPDCELIALGLTRYWKAEDGLRLDTAPYVAALECATGKKARVFGKPGREFFHAAAAKLSLAPEELVMVGDDLVTDIEGAKKAGLKAILVRSGKYSSADTPQGPDLTMDSVESLPGLVSSWF